MQRMYTAYTDPKDMQSTVHVVDGVQYLCI